MEKTITIYSDDSSYHEYIRRLFEEENELETDRQFREERLLKEWDKEFKAVEENEDVIYYEKYLLTEYEALEEKKLFAEDFYYECEELASGIQMKKKILSREVVKAIQDEFYLPEEEGFYQYILEDDMQKILTEEDYENYWGSDYYDDALAMYEIDKEERRHDSRYNGWLSENGLRNSEDAYWELNNLFYKIDYYYIGGPCETEGYVNSYECDSFFDNIFNPNTKPDIKEREINEEYSLRKFEALISISPNASDEEIEKFLYLYEYNSKKFHLPTEIKRVRDYIQSEEHINEFRFTKLSDILKNR
jgi:hypothetical protein